MQNRTRHTAAEMNLIRREAEAAGRRVSLKRAVAFAGYTMLAIAVVGVVKHATKA